MVHRAVGDILIFCKAARKIFSTLLWIPTANGSFICVHPYRNALVWHAFCPHSGDKTLSSVFPWDWKTMFSIDWAVTYVHFANLFQSWDSFFRQTAKGAPPGLAYVRPPTLTAAASMPMPLPLHAVTQGAPVDEKTIEDHLSVQSIIRSYQVIQAYCKRFCSELLDVEFSCSVFKSHSTVKLISFYLKWNKIHQNTSKSLIYTTFCLKRVGGKWSWWNWEGRNQNLLLSVGKAHRTVLWDWYSPSFTVGTFDSFGISAEGTLISASAVPHLIMLWEMFLAGDTLKGYSTQ